MFRSATQPGSKLLVSWGGWLLIAMMLMTPAIGLAQVKADADGIPEVQGEFLNDFTGKIQGVRKVEISSTLRRGSRTSRIHTVLVVINKLGDFPKMPQKIDGFAENLANKWRKQFDDIGILIVFSLEDKKAYAAKSAKLDPSLTRSIEKAIFSESTKGQLLKGNITQAMFFASQSIRDTLTSHASANAKPKKKTSASGGKSGYTKTVRRTTRTPRRGRRSRRSRSGGTSIMSWLCPILIVVMIIVAVVGMFSGRRHGYGGGGHGGGYGGGYGGGGGGFMGGMMTGGMLGYMFGGGMGGHGYGGGYGGYGDGGYTETTESWSESGGGDYDGGGGGGFDDGGFTDYGDFDGGGSMGEW